MMDDFTFHAVTGVDETHSGRLEDCDRCVRLLSGEDEPPCCAEFTDFGVCGHSKGRTS